MRKMEECSICFDEIFQDRAELDCGHIFHLSCVIYIKDNICPTCKEKILENQTILILLKNFHKNIMTIPEVVRSRKENMLIKNLCEEIADITEYFKKDNRTSFDLFLCGYFERLVELTSRWSRKIKK
jgi:hypothetical protein